MLLCQLMTLARNIFLLISLLFFTFASFGQVTHKEYKLEKLSSLINTPNYDEIAPVCAFDGHSMYFTRVGHPDFNKTLVEQGKDLSLEMSPTGFMNYLSQIYSRLGRRTVMDPVKSGFCLLYTSPSPRDKRQSRMPSSA